MFVQHEYDPFTVLNSPTKSLLNPMKSNDHMEDEPSGPNDSDQEENHSSSIDPYIGKKVRKKFEDDNWYEGTVQFSWKRNGKLLYRIKYDDDQCEDSTTKTLVGILIVDQQVNSLHQSLYDQSSLKDDNTFSSVSHINTPLALNATLGNLCTRNHNNLFPIQLLDENCLSSPTSSVDLCDHSSTPGIHAKDDLFVT